jgi:outer membrane protein
MTVVRTLLAAGACVLALVAAPVQAQGYKIGVIHTERILRDSAPARAAQARIEQQFKARDAEIGSQEQALRTQAAQYEKEKSGLGDEQRAARERELEARGREVQRLRQQFAEDLRTRQFEELDKLKERLDQAITRLAHEQGYDLILQDALWVGKSVDITDDVIKALGP